MVNTQVHPTDSKELNSLKVMRRIMNSGCAFKRKRGFIAFARVERSVVKVSLFFNNFFSILVTSLQLLQQAGQSWRNHKRIGSLQLRST